MENIQAKDGWAVADKIDQFFNEVGDAGDDDYGLPANSHPRHIPTRWECVMMIRECDTVIYNYDDDLGSSTGGGGRPRSRREDKKS